MDENDEANSEDKALEIGSIWWVVLGGIWISIQIKRHNYQSWVPRTSPACLLVTYKSLSCMLHVAGAEQIASLATGIMPTASTGLCW